MHKIESSEKLYNLWPNLDDNCLSKQKTYDSAKHPLEKAERLIDSWRQTATKKGFSLPNFTCQPSQEGHILNVATTCDYTVKKIERIEASAGLDEKRDPFVKLEIAGKNPANEDFTFSILVHKFLTKHVSKWSLTTQYQKMNWQDSVTMANACSFPMEILFKIAKCFPDGNCQDMLLVNKAFTAAADAILINRIKFLEELALRCLKINFHPDRLNKCKALMEEAVTLELHPRMSCIRDAIVVLFEGYSNTLWTSISFDHPFHVDKPLLVKLLHQTEDKDEVRWVFIPRLELLLSYLELMKKNLISPETLYVETDDDPDDNPFDKLYTTPIAEAVSNCSSLKEVKLHFNGWTREAMEPVLIALNKNQNIHTAVFCNLIPLPENHQTCYIRRKKDYQTECFSLIYEKLGEQFLIEQTVTLQAPSLTLTRMNSKIETPNIFLHYY